MNVPGTSAFFFLNKHQTGGDHLRMMLVYGEMISLYRMHMDMQHDVNDVARTFDASGGARF